MVVGCSIVNVGDKVVTYPDIPMPLYYNAIRAETPAEFGVLAIEVESMVRYKVA